MPRVLAALIIVWFAGSGTADPPKIPAFDPALYRSIGPGAGGRVCRVAGVAGDALTAYVATASGGIWKTADAGLTWKPIFDSYPTASVGSLAVAPSDANIVYAGTGEANIRGNVTLGAGIFKSTDAGKTWHHVWKQRGQIGTLIVHPTNPDIAFAAVFGDPFVANPERGVYRTTDGGRTWNQVLKIDADTGASDVALNPANPRVIFAGTWQARRRPWDLTSGGPGSGLHVSRDGGDTWQNLTHGAPENGLPEGVWGKVGVAVAPSNGQRVYAIIEADKGGLFRSDDGGTSWSVVNESRPLRQRAWYYSNLTVHPSNPDVVYAPQVSLLKSIDGGKTFQSVPGLHHGDHHDLWIDPKNPERVLNGNDGGIDLSSDGGRTWFAPPLPISQFYHIHADNRTPFHVMGCMQDLGSASGPSRTRHGSIGLADWTRVGGGEAGFCVSDPADPNIVYAGEYGGILTRFDTRTGVARNITVNQTNPSGIDPALHEYRFQWTAPLVVSRHKPGAVYHAGNVVFKTTDQGQTWEKISPDLTRNDKRKQQWSGGPITGDNTGAETYCTVFALAESPLQAGLLWAGSDDGKVHVTKDGGQTWTDLTANVPDLPDWGTVECIEPSPHADGTAYLVVDNHRLGDTAPYLWKTTDFGQTWTRLTDGLTADVNLNAVREDPKKAGVLYLATERGICTSPDAGATWQSLQQNLPTVPVADLVVKDDALVVGTHGRSVWILDDLTVVRAGAKAADEKPVVAYPPLPVTLNAANSGGPVSSHLRRLNADNPHAGALIHYNLSTETKEITLTITDATGQVVTTVVGKRRTKSTADEPDEDAPPPAKEPRKMSAVSGAQSYVWDLHYDGADTIPGAQVDAGDPGQGVAVPPGQYTATFTAGEFKTSVPIEVRPDPRLPAAEPTVEVVRLAAGLTGELVAMLAPQTAAANQTELALAIRDDITTLSRTVKRLRLMQKQLDLRRDLLADDPAAAELLKASKTYAEQLLNLERRLHNPDARIVYDIFSARGGAMLYSQLTWVLNNVTDGTGPPTQAMRTRAAECRAELEKLVEEFTQLTGEPLGKLNTQARDRGVPEVYVPPARPTSALDSVRR